MLDVVMIAALLGSIGLVCFLLHWCICQVEEDE